MEEGDERRSTDGMLLVKASLTSLTHVMVWA